jgi:hypothetical protein
MRIEVDCGKHGKITWELPDDLAVNDAAQTEQHIKMLCEQHIARFIKLLAAIMLSGKHNAKQGFQEVEEAITRLAAYCHLRGRGTN